MNECLFINYYKLKQMFTYYKITYVIINCHLRKHHIITDKYTHSKGNM